MKEKILKVDGNEVRVLSGLGDVRLVAKSVGKDATCEGCYFSCTYGADHSDFVELERLYRRPTSNKFTELRTKWCDRYACSSLVRKDRRKVIWVEKK